MRKTGKLLFLALWLLPLALWAADAEVKARLLAALPADVSFIYIEPGAVMKSRFATEMLKLFPEESRLLSSVGDDIAGTVDAAVIFFMRPAGVKASAAGLIIHSQCADLKELSQKIRKIHAAVLPDGELPQFEVSGDGQLVCGGTPVARRLAPHLFLFAEPAAMFNYSPAGVPAAVGNELETVAANPVFGYIPSIKRCSSCVFGVGFDADRLNMSFRGEMADAAAAAEAVEMWNAGKNEFINNMKKGMPRLAGKLASGITVKAEGNQLRIKVGLDADAAALIVASAAVPALIQARQSDRDKREKLAAAAAAEAAGDAKLKQIDDESVETNQTGGK